MQTIANSNTTLVKVKYREWPLCGIKFYIQIQHLLKLNLWKLHKQTQANKIQIQHLLKLNLAVSAET